MRSLVLSIFISGFIFLFSLAASAQLVPTEENLPAFYNSTLVPYFQTGQSFDFPGELNVRLHGYAFFGGSTAVIIVPGWHEPARKYMEVVYNLAQKGYSVFLMDHRGQGESARIAPCFCSYVEDYKYYVKDLATFIQGFVLPHNFQKTFILAHSMGGGITAALLEAYPNIVDGAVLSSPMFKIFTDPYPEFVAKALARSMVLLGKGQERRLFDTDKPDVFATNTVTHSEARWTMYKSLPLNAPDLKVGWATNKWLSEMFDMTDKIQSIQPGKIKAKILILQSAKDYFVVGSAQIKVCAKIATCQVEKIPNTLHEILQEKDQARNQAFNLIFNFFN